MDGAPVESATAIGGLRSEACEKTYFVERVRIAVEAAGQETRAVRRLRVTCVSLVALLLGSDINRCSNRFGFR